MFRDSDRYVFIYIQHHIIMYITVIIIKYFNNCLYWKIISNIGKDKSIVDDFSKEQGVVSMKVVFVLRSAEI